MWEKLQQIWSVKEVRNSLLFVFAMMVLFRFAANLPVPGIDLLALKRFFDANQMLGVLNLFSGGTIRNFSVIALGIAPYITASIILQLLGMVFPRLEEIQKEGEAGQRKINQWTRLLTVPLAIIQSFALLSLMRQSQVPILTNTNPFHVLTIIFTVTAGTLILMWIGELISERKVGNGASMLICAGILAELPTNLSQFISVYDSSQIWNVLIFIAVAIVTIVGVVFVNEGQRNIPVQYARQVRGMGSPTGGVASSLPLRVNTVGVIPIIFAISLLLFPTFIAQFLTRAHSAWIASAAQWVIVTMQNQLIYGIFYFLLVVLFTFFYTSIVFKPQKISENLQKQGGFIPGIRPGNATTEYLQGVINRMTLGGAIFLGLIAVLPIAVQGLTGTQSLALGGTSLLIIVSVVIESVKQIESQMTMRQYESY